MACRLGRDRRELPLRPWRGRRRLAARSRSASSTGSACRRCRCSGSTASACRRRGSASSSARGRSTTRRACSVATRGSRGSSSVATREVASSASRPRTSPSTDRRCDPPAACTPASPCFPDGGRACRPRSRSGWNPTFGEGRPISVEAHLLDFSGDLYDQTAAAGVPALPAARAEVRLGRRADRADAARHRADADERHEHGRNERVERARRRRAYRSAACLARPVPRSDRNRLQLRRELVARRQVSRGAPRPRPCASRGHARRCSRPRPRRRRR